MKINIRWNEKQKSFAWEKSEEETTLCTLTQEFYKNIVNITKWKINQSKATKSTKPQVALTKKVVKILQM